MPDGKQNGWPIALITLLLGLGWLSGSAMHLLKYAHRVAPLAAVIGLCFLFACIWAVGQEKFQKKQPPMFFFALLWLVMCAFYAVVHPLSTKHTITQGNDSEDAIIKGAGNLLHFHFPYDALTYLGKPITPMPGALFLALPFAIIQHVGFQNLIWLGAFILLALTYFRSRLTAFIFMCVILANAHTFVNLLTGADYPTNWFYVAVASFLFLRSPSGWPRWASSILLGLALSSRPTYLLFIPPLLLALLIQRDGLPRAVARLAPPLVLCSIVTLSFYLYAPSRFSPLHVTGFLSFTPLAYRLIAMAAILGPALVVVVSSFFIRMSVPRVFLLASISLAIVLFPTGIATLHRSGLTVDGTILLGYTDAAYGFFCLWAFRFLEDRAIPAEQRSSASLRYSSEPVKPALRI